jgi:hypothetical protein
MLYGRVSLSMAIAITDPLQIRNPLTDRNQTQHNSLRSREILIGWNSSSADKRGPAHKGSRASAVTLSTVLRITTLSYGNMRFSGTCPAETLIKLKFCTIAYIGKFTRCAKNGWNRLTGGGPTDRWNITSKTLLAIPYFTLPFFIECLYSPNRSTDLYARWLKRRGLLQGSAYWGSRW